MYTSTTERIEGVNSIIISIKINSELHNFLWIELHRNPFNIYNNNGLYWIWSSTMSTLLIDFYKLMKTNEKFSFKKLINICIENKEPINCSELNKRLDSLNLKYDENNFELIRSKILAHQDINVTEQRTDLLKLKEFIDEIIEFYDFFCFELKYISQNSKLNVLEDLKLIFDRLDECDKISSYLITKQLQGKKSLDFELMEKEIGEL